MVERDDLRAPFPAAYRFQSTHFRMYSYILFLVVAIAVVVVVFLYSFFTLKLLALNQKNANNFHLIISCLRFSATCIANSIIQERDGKCSEQKNVKNHTELEV